MVTYRFGIAMKQRWVWSFAAILAALGTIFVFSFPRTKQEEVQNPAAYWAREYGIVDYYEVGGLLRDRVELDPEFQRIAPEVAKEVEKAVEGSERGLGFIHEWEREKQRILKERHGIKWRTLSEMNPWVSID